MSGAELFALIAASSASLLCAVLLIFERRKTKRMLLTLGRMLDSALDGSFEELSFDESLLSALENRFRRYLSASALSERRLSSEKEKIKELLADISHQTKTPLSNILLYAQLLEERDMTGESAVCLAALRDQAEKLSFLISSLLKLSQLETGSISLNPVCGPVAPVLEEAAEQFAMKAAPKGISMTVETSDAVAVFDRKWTAEAICNILDNAVKYTPPGGSVRICVKNLEMFCRIDVADTGTGIPESEHAKVFSRFYRSEAASDQEGAGIGLYLTRQILSGQGGYVKVSSSPGRGSVFSVFLPRQA